MLAPHLGPYAGRVVSFAVAVVTTWVLNRRFAFADRAAGAGLGAEFGRYLTAMLAGGAVNYGLYALMVATLDPVARWPVIGVAAGSVAGLVVNFTLARAYVFRSGGE